MTDKQFTRVMAALEAQTHALAALGGQIHQLNEAFTLLLNQLAEGDEEELDVTDLDGFTTLARERPAGREL